MRTLLAITVLFGCTAPPPAPDPVRVEPPWGYTDSDTTVRVIGTSFYPSLGVSAGGGDEVVDDGFVVRLLDTEGRATASLVGVQLEDLNTLVGVVPSGLTAGTYDVEVVAPSGQIGLEVDAFSIRTTRVERVDLDVDAVSHEVFEEATVLVSLRSQGDGPVREDLPVRLRFERLDGADFVGQVRIDGLEQAVTTREGAVIRIEGQVGSDGAATLYPLLESPGEVEVTVEAPDAPVRVVGDDLRLAWDRGQSVSVRVSLPSDPFEARAGQPFTATLELVDQYGNLAVDAVATLAITDACASVAQGVRIVGRGDVTVVPLQATNTTRCPQDRLVVSGAGVSGESEPFDVLPGPAVGLQVVAGPSPVRAGATLSALVSAVDAWSNLTPWSGVVTALEDGSLDLTDVACTVGDQLAYCVAVPRRAGVGLRLRVTSQLGLFGTSNPLTVRAAAPVRLDADVPGTWTAGEPVIVRPVALDAWSNRSATAVVDLASVRLEGPNGVLPCAVLEDTLRCSLRQVAASTPISVTGTVVEDGVSWALAGTAGPVRVVHGPLAVVQVTPDVLAVPSSTLVGVGILAKDAWGNRFTDAAGTLVTVHDLLGDVAPLAVPIDGTGEGRVSVVLRRAGSNRLVASAQGAVLGQSAEIVVSPGAPSQLQVEPLVPWAWVGEAAAFRVDAVDDQGNRVSLADTSVEVRSEGGAGPPVVLALVNGSAVGTFRYDTWSPADRWVARTQGGPVLEGTGEARGVARRCASGAPTASVRFASQSFARACFDPGGNASVAGDFGTSTPGAGQALTRYALALDGEPVVSSASRVSVTTSEAGALDLWGWVQQNDGCGAETRTYLYVGPDDGSAVGPLRVDVLGVPDLVAQPVVDVRVSEIETCHGVAAAGTPVRVRTDRGALLDLVPTGLGLEGASDALGVLAAKLDVSGTSTGGTTTLTAWSPGRTAFGSASFTVLGDNKRPTVWRMTPEGALGVPADTIDIRFSEPLDPSSLSTGAVDLRGPVPMGWTAALVDGDRTLRVYPDQALLPEAGQWVLRVESIVTDRAGNPLDGAWRGQASAFEGLIGGSGTPVVVSSCQLDAVVLEPDGDPGTDALSDERVGFSFTAATVPAWWGLEVRDADGQPLVITQVAGNASSGSWVWDGRDTGGRVVGAGFYTVSVQAEDDRGNRGNACERTVVVDVVEAVD